MSEKKAISKWYPITLGFVAAAIGGYMYYQHVWKPKHEQKVAPADQGSGGGGVVVVTEKQTVEKPSTSGGTNVKPVAIRPRVPINTAVPQVAVVAPTRFETPSFNGEMACN